jgi:S-DNA-T family DNA segregation ATPase FtsK/SpoIIIE
VSDDEINSIIECVGTSEPQFVKELVQLKASEPAGGEKGANLSSKDELYESAIEVVIREGRGSVSLLQRALGIGYGRAARLIDYMAEDGIVGQYAGSQAREVLVTMEQWYEMSGQASGDSPARPAPTPQAPVPPRSGRVLTVAERSPPRIDDEEEDEEYDEDADEEYEEEDGSESDDPSDYEEDEYEEEDEDAA